MGPVNIAHVGQGTCVIVSPRAIALFIPELSRVMPPGSFFLAHTATTRHEQCKAPHSGTSCLGVGYPESGNRQEQHLTPQDLYHEECLIIVGANPQQ